MGVLLVVVVLGVLATEAVPRLRDHAVYMSAWKVRRIAWLNWLSEDLS